MRVERILPCKATKISKDSHLVTVRGDGAAASRLRAAPAAAAAAARAVAERSALGKLHVPRREILFRKFVAVLFCLTESKP